MRYLIRPLIATGLMLALSQAVSAAADKELLSEYLQNARDPVSALTNSGFRAGVSSLTRQFNDICGDTFCEGEFSAFHKKRLTEISALSYLEDCYGLVTSLLSNT